MLLWSIRLRLDEKKMMARKDVFFNNVLLSLYKTLVSNYDMQCVQLKRNIDEKIKSALTQPCNHLFTRVCATSSSSSVLQTMLRAHSFLNAALAVHPSVLHVLSFNVSCTLLTIIWFVCPFLLHRFIHFAWGTLLLGLALVVHPSYLHRSHARHTPQTLSWVVYFLSWHGYMSSEFVPLPLQFWILSVRKVTLRFSMPLAHSLV